MSLSKYSLEIRKSHKINNEQLDVEISNGLDLIIHKVLCEYLGREANRDEINSKLNLEPLDSAGLRYFFYFGHLFLGRIEKEVHSRNILLFFYPSEPNPPYDPTSLIL